MSVVESNAKWIPESVLADSFDIPRKTLKILRGDRGEDWDYRYGAVCWSADAANLLSSRLDEIRSGKNLQPCKVGRSRLEREDADEVELTVLAAFRPPWLWVAKLDSGVPAYLYSRNGRVCLGDRVRAKKRETGNIYDVATP